MSIAFVIEAPLGASARSRELMTSQVRSHAARVAHRRSTLNETGPSRRRFNHYSVFQVSQFTAAETLCAQCPPKKVVPDPTWHLSSPRRQSAEYVSPWALMSDEKDTIACEDNNVEITTRSMQTMPAPFRPPYHKTQSPPPSLTLEIEDIAKKHSQVCVPGYFSYCKLWNVRPSPSEPFLALFADELWAHVGTAYVKFECNQLINPNKEDLSVLYHNTEALSLIRKRIMSSDGTLDDVSILTIMCLPLVDDLSSTSEASKIHWHTVFKLLNTRRKRSKLLESDEMSTYFQETMDGIRTFAGFKMNVDYTTAGNSPHPYPESLPKSPMEPPIYFPNPLPGLPPGITSLLIAGLLGPTTIAMTQRLLQMTTNTLPTNEHPTTSSFVDAWHLNEITPSTIPTEPSIEELLPTAMLAYSSWKFAGPLGLANSAARSNRRILTVKLVRFREQRCQEEEEALFWVFVVTIESWRTRMGELQEEGRKVRKLMLERLPWARNRELAMEVLKWFFFDEKLLMSWTGM